MPIIAAFVVSLAHFLVLYRAARAGEDAARCWAR